MNDCRLKNRTLRDTFPDISLGNPKRFRSQLKQDEFSSIKIRVAARWSSQHRRTATMKRMTTYVLCAAFGLWQANVQAHHSDEATYRVRDKVQIEGTVSQIQIRNPHSWIFIDVKGADGKVQRWGAEWRGATQLAKEGVSNDTLKVGERVVIDASPARNPNDFRVLLRVITRSADGKAWGERE